MNVAPYQTLERTDLTEQTYQVLKTRILRRELQPGEKIAVEEIASRLGVSRSPVVAALQQLANDGLVEIIPQRGTFVTELTTRDVADLFDIRLMIEEYAARLVIGKGYAHRFLERTRDVMVAMEQATAGEEYTDYEAFINRDHDLHLTLIELTGNQHLVRMYNDLNVHIHVARAHYLNSVENAREARTEHEAIIRAFERSSATGNADDAVAAIRSHVLNVRERLLRILEQRGGRL